MGRETNVQSKEENINGGGFFDKYSTTVTDFAAAPTKPLTKQDLINYFVSGCKPKDQWRIGTEHEKFGFEVETLRPIKYDQIKELLYGIAERFGWDPIIDGGNIFALKKGQQCISLEAGGQIEFGGAPVETLHQAFAEIDTHIYQVKEVAKDMGIGFLGIGYNPKWKYEEIPKIPKERYEVMRRFFPKVGTLGNDMLDRTCSIQVNLDYGSEADMIKKLRASLALQPIATALFANSPFTEGKPNGYLSKRSKIWTETDDSRTGLLPFVFDESFGFEKFVDYALDVPMIYVRRKNNHILCDGKTFRDFMEGKLDCLPGEFPTINDWNYHLGTIYTEVRFRRYLEMRGADAGPISFLYALPAFWVGLLYDETSLQNVVDMIADWTQEERQMLRVEVPRTGLKTPFRGGLLREVAEVIVKWAKEGLKRRGLKESMFLDEIEEIAKTGETRAEKLLKMYHGKWEENVDKVYEHEELLY
ncbi:glutamate--cysteine ligase, chloroplastic-like [Ziziphus jujuba]|uniref:Glutamate--cysteine ligase n=1 Tax=Ziziphus jujuba TaxID=326968 RepID=A0ABM3I3Y3_ZIZJJ|nr:glutamate--cysteine ligase, chloroplastic-like [Ziziphus jujuba]